jgi:hypothetical protein
MLLTPGDEPTHAQSETKKKMSQKPKTANLNLNAANFFRADYNPGHLTKAEPSVDGWLTVKKKNKQVKKEAKHGPKAGGVAAKVVAAAVVPVPNVVVAAKDMAAVVPVPKVVVAAVVPVDSQLWDSDSDDEDVPVVKAVAPAPKVVSKFWDSCSDDSDDEL